MDCKGRLTVVALGGVIYYIVIGIVIWLKMDSNDLKLFTAIIVAIFLAVPYLKAQSKNSCRRAAKRGAMMKVSQDSSANGKEV